ncbi:hypothetical protein [Kordiimonas sp.]|uniref:hypothetical protein n=1 Tax=Kordiimonas sp. TaxID=1970157 RepID=UPI003A8E2EED
MRKPKAFFLPSILSRRRRLIEPGRVFQLLWVLLFSVISSDASPANSAEGEGDARPLVHWYSFNYPPAFIMDGPFKAQGYQDQILDYFEERLVDFRIRRHETALARVIANVRYGEAACASALAKTEDRARFMVFSEPILTSLPLRLVVNSTRSDELKQLVNEHGRIGLPQLAALEGLSGAAVKDRSYGPHIDPWMHVAREKGDLHVAARSELAFLMLARGRVDYTFGYPDEVGYFMRLHEGKDMMDTLTTLPLEEETILVESYIGCSVDPVGQQVINAVNQIMQDKQHDNALLVQPYLQWIDAAAQHDLQTALQK